MGFGSFFKSIVDSIASALSSSVEESETRTFQIQVLDVKVDTPFDFDPVDAGSVITLKKDAKFRLDIKRFANIDGKKKWHKAQLTVNFGKGFQTNGTSSPKLVYLQLPPYIARQDKNSNVYNAAAFIHDGLYACKGEIVEEGKSKGKNKWRYTLTRKECDNILSEIWVQSKFVGEIAAKIIGAGTNVFASGPEHWDNDDLHCKAHFSVKIKYLT